MQFFKFPLTFSRQNRARGEDALFVCVWMFPFAVRHECGCSIVRVQTARERQMVLSLGIRRSERRDADPRIRSEEI